MHPPKIVLRKFDFMTLFATFTPQPPYRFDLLLETLRRYPHPTLDRVQGDAMLRTVGDPDGAAVLRITMPDEQLRVEWIAQMGTPQPDTIRQQLRHILAVDDPTRAAFVQFAREHPALWQVVESVAGLPLLRSATLFEALTQVIIEQHISWVAAQRAQGVLVRWASDGIPVMDSTFYPFPAPHQIADASLEELKPLKITHRRIGMLIEVARHWVSGAFDPQQVIADSHGMAHLMQLKGVGQWTAAVVMGRALGAYIAVPHTDAALQAAVNAFFVGQTGRASPEQVQAVFVPYDPYAGLAAIYVLMRWVLERYPRTT